MNKKRLRIFNISNFLTILALSSSLLFVGCGGGGDDGGSASTGATTLSGTAAAGAAIIGQVTVKGSLGNTKSALIEANGNYNVDVTGLTPPYRLRAEGTVGGRTYKLHSYAEASDVGGTVNITPFTDLIVANAAQQIAETYFDSVTPADLDPAEVTAQEDALQTKLQAVLTALGVSDTIDLLRTSFNADHSGLDAVMDVVQVDVDPATQIARIKNLIDNSFVDDNLTTQTDNTSALVVAPGTSAVVTDIQAIVAKFNTVTNVFATGLPTEASITDDFSSNFFDGDYPKSVFLTDITTNPSLIGLSFNSIVVSGLNDATPDTAVVKFGISINGVNAPEPFTNTWLMAKDPTLGWQFLGDQRIADIEFSYHCNDFDGTGSFAGSCGINTQIWDRDFTNNNTGGAAIASGTMKVIDGTDGTTVKGTVYLGTPASSAPGDVQVYDEGNQVYAGDWKAFGAALGEINSAIFTVGDIIQFDLYTQPLDITTAPSAPAIAAGAAPVASYQDTLIFAPSLDLTKLPSATAATVTAINNFTLGNNLTVAWTLAAGTRNDEVLVSISDNLGNRMETWNNTSANTTPTLTVASTALDSAAATTAGLNPIASTYNLLVRVYAKDELTGQFHSRDYTAVIPGPGAPPPPPPAGLACNFLSGWDNLDPGSPIVPKSFADYEESLASCATDGTPAQSFTVADMAGNAFSDQGDIITLTNSAGAGTMASPKMGTFNDGTGPLNLQWYVEAATCSGCTHSYLVIYSDPTIDANLGTLSIRQTSALIGITGTAGVAGAGYTLHKYSEQSNYGDMVREIGADGEIWFSTDILQ